MIFSDGGRSMGEEETVLTAIDRRSEEKESTESGGGGFGFMLGGFEATEGVAS